MKLSKHKLGIKALLTLMVLVPIACAAWPHLQPFAYLTMFPRKGNVTGTEKTYIWRNGLAIAVTRFPGEWPSFHRKNMDVAELLREEEEALLEDAELARSDAAQQAR